MNARTMDPNPGITEDGKSFSILKIGKVRYICFSAYSVFANGERMDYGGILGRYHGMIRVTAPVNSIFSTIRGKVDAMEKRLGTKLEFAIADRDPGKAGKTVTLACHVYDPSKKPLLAELERFKQD